LALADQSAVALPVKTFQLAFTDDNGLLYGCGSSAMAAFQSEGAGFVLADTALFLFFQKETALSLTNNIQSNIFPSKCARDFVGY